MAWIKTIGSRNATGKLREIYGEIEKSRGKLSNIMQVQSLNPAAMKAHLDLYIPIMFSRSAIGREEREMIAVVVSKANRCDYCINHHSEALNFYWKDRVRIRQFIKDFRTSGINQDQQEMLQYAEKLTLQPAAVKEADIDLLRKQGLADRDILDINLITAYFNFVNRIANGLGVEFSDDEVNGYKY